MARFDHPIHGFLASVLGPAVRPGATLLDLGCGTGGTLSALGRIAPGAKLLGLDSSDQSLAQARSLLARQNLDFWLENADLEQPLPIPEASIDGLVSHNVLECLADPAVLMHEAARVLRPGGRAVWSHVDFEAIVMAGAEAALDRRVLGAYADLTPTWMTRGDARMGRKLSGLVRNSALALDRIEPFVTSSADLAGDATARVQEINQALKNEAALGKGNLTEQEVDRWRAQLEEAAAQARFLFAEVSFVAVSYRPEAPPERS